MLSAQTFRIILVFLEKFLTRCRPLCELFRGELFGVCNAMSHGLSKDMFVTQLVPFVPFD
jgi:hypothetical protein